MRLTLSQKRANAGKKGGTVTLKKYGLNHFKQIGHDGGLVGGRPKLKTLSEIRSLINIAEKEGRLVHRNSFVTNLVMDLVQDALAYEECK